MDARLFYTACEIDRTVGEAIEEKYRSSLAADQEMLQAICTHYDIPEEWLREGVAAEIEN